MVFCCYSHNFTKLYTFLTLLCSYIVNTDSHQVLYLSQKENTMKSAMLTTLSGLLIASSVCLASASVAYAGDLNTSNSKQTKVNAAPKLSLVKSSAEFAKVYPSDDNKIAKLLKSFRKLGSLSTLTNDPERYATNIISWQMDHGGFGLHDAAFYEHPWDGKQSRSEWVSKGRELGNFDDDAIAAEMRFLAEAYTQVNDPALKAAIKQSVERCMEFIFKAQYEHGGWPQVYPKRYNTTYSNNVTLNDNAMIRTMVLLSDMLANIAPFDSDLLSEETKNKIYPSLAAAVQYLLKAQIKNNDTLTIWASQYDPQTYAPASARSYELASKSGKESVGVLSYLMNWPEQSEEVVAAVRAGVTWYENNKIKDMVLKKGVFTEKSGEELWYRFYEVDSNVPFFCGRDGVKKYDLAEVEAERRKGYSWGDHYASKVLRVAPRYFALLQKK